MPTLTLAGDRDPLLRSSNVASYADVPPLRRLAWIARSGHTLDRRDAVAAAVVMFVTATTAQ